MKTDWIAMGDYNNVLTSKDRVGGNDVTKSEYRDLTSMMQNNGLFYACTKGSHFTWSNKHTVRVIYSNIDRVIGNIDWFQKYQDVVVEVLVH